MQYDKSTIKDENVGFEKKIFLSSASFKYPTVKLKQLKELDVNSIAADDCILFMWTTGPQMANSIELGEAWGFEYKTVAFVWDKMVHNPGRYTLSQTEFVLAFKKGKFPQPRGARNVRQMVTIHRGAHEVYSEKADATRVLIVIRKAERQNQITRRNFINLLKRELPIKLEQLFLGEIDEQDRSLTAMGAGLQIFSQYKKILNADASLMSVHDALQIINQETREYIDQHFNTRGGADTITKEEETHAR